MRIPYQLTAAVSTVQRREHMVHSIARGLPRLQDVPIDPTKTLTIAAYGPSLQDTWQEMRHPIMGCSGSTKWLAERGVVVDYHVDMDPRQHKRLMISPPVPGVTYVIASHCEPAYFDMLKDEKVILWHAVSSSEAEDLDWVYRHDPGQLVISTGSNVGLGALQVGGVLGYRHFELHGADHCVREGGIHHAGEHTGKIQKGELVWPANGKKFYTSKILANGAAEFVNTLKAYPIFCVIHGDGLVQALLAEADLPNAALASQTEKAERVRAAVARFVNISPVPKSERRTGTAWDVLCPGDPPPSWMVELQDSFAAAEARRPLAKFNTGSISMETGLLLRYLCERWQPKVIAEIGTFIGKSTTAMRAERIYTCDKDNDCLQDTETIRTHPGYTSTRMLSSLVGEGVKVDMFFFDGRIGDLDVTLVRELSHPDTVLVFDDFHANGKGVANLEKLGPSFPNHGFVGPSPEFLGRTTLALLVPLKISYSEAVA